MKVFIYDDKTHGTIVTQAQSMNVDLLTIQDVRNRSQVPDEYAFFLDEVELLIMEMTKPTRDITFIIAQAILAQKPTLLLYGKNQPPREVLQMIRGRSTPRPIRTFSYTERNLEYAVERFIRMYREADQIRDDEPSIKFTLRLSPNIERFLNWICEGTTKTKADYMRELVQREQERNDEYQKRGVLEPPTESPTKHLTLPQVKE